jgi:ArsR family transcriptional regulator
MDTPPLEVNTSPESENRQEGLMRAPPAAGCDHVVRWFRALGDETRLRIIERLRAGEESVGHLAAVLATGQSRLSFHLKTLRDAGLVRDRRQGRLTYYALDLAAFHAMAQVLESVQRPQDPAMCQEAGGPAAELP